MEFDVRPNREGVVLPIRGDAPVRGGRHLHRETRDEDGDVLDARFIPNERLVHVLEDLDARGLDVRRGIEGIRFSECRRREDSRMFQDRCGSRRRHADGVSGGQGPHAGDGGQRQRQADEKIPGRGEDVACGPDRLRTSPALRRTVPPAIGERREEGSVVRGGDHDRGTSFGSIRNVVPIPTVGPGGVPVEPDGGPGDHGRLIRRQDRGPWTEDAVRRARTVRRPGGGGDLRRGKLGLDEEELPVVRRFAAPAVRHREEADVPPRDRVGMGRDRADRG